MTPILRWWMTLHAGGLPTDFVIVEGDPLQEATTLNDLVEAITGETLTEAP